MTNLPVLRKFLLLLCNLIPLAQITAMGLLGWWLRGSPWHGLAAILAVVYVLPPLACRAAVFVLPIRRTVIPVGSREFFVWWYALNLQLLFCRFGFLEELLRLVPGCYSFWLRLWGAKVGTLTYWAAGTTILDRPWLEIGDHVVFGAGVRLSGHLLRPDAEGGPVLLLAPVRIGDRATVGAYSLLGPGAEIVAGQCGSALLVLPPFSRWENGRRHKPSQNQSGSAEDSEHDR
jgi:hypothetical protein